MRVLLIGANGQLGTELQRSLAPLGEVIPATRAGVLADGRPCERADLGDPDGVAALVARVSPDVVANAAAYTAVDRAEDEPGEASLANTRAPAAMADACARAGALLVHYSTDYVFDGRGTRPYREHDPTAPLGVYGKTKRAGELAIEASGCRHFIVRTAWVYAAHGANFLRTMLRVGAERDALRVVSDQVGTPTPAALIADCTTSMIRRAAAGSAPDRGTWHLTASGMTSWHGFAEAIFDGAMQRGLLERRPAVHAIATAEYPTRAERPAYSVLDLAALERDFAIAPPTWQEGLGRVLDELARRPPPA